MRASIAKRLSSARFRGSIILMLGVLTALSCFLTGLLQAEVSRAAVTSVRAQALALTTIEQVAASLAYMQAGAGIKSGIAAARGREGGYNYLKSQLTKHMGKKAEPEPDQLIRARLIGRKFLETEPAETFNYNRMVNGLVRKMIDKLTGTPYDDLLARMPLQPSGTTGYSGASGEVPGPAQQSANAGQGGRATVEGCIAVLEWCWRSESNQ